MCKPCVINNCVECILNHVLLGVEFNNTDSSEFDNDHIELDDDPNVFFNDEIELVTSEWDSDSLESDPNDYSDEEYMLNYENNSMFNIVSLSSPATEHPSDGNDLPVIECVKGYILENDNDHVFFHNQDELDDIYDRNYESINDDKVVKSLFIYDPYPVIDYVMIDCELVIDSVLEHTEGIINNKDKHICHYCF